MNVQAAESLLKLAEDAGPGLRGLDAKAVFQQLEQQYGDLQVALKWFIEQRRADEALRLASALGAFWMATKRLGEGSAWLDRALALTGADNAHRGRALFDAGYLAFWKGDDERSASLQNRALELGRRTKNPTVTALALVGLARIALRTNVGEARRLCREALAATEGTTDRLGRSSAMHVLAVGAQMAGNLLEAGELMSQRIALAREAGNFAVISSEAGNLSMVERQLGHLDEAEALAREALDIDRRRGDDLAIPWKVNGLAAVAADRGELVRGATLIGIADGAMEAAGGAWPPDERQQYERTVAALADAMGSAELDRARATGRAMSKSEAIDFALGRSTRMYKPDGYTTVSPYLIVAGASATIEFLRSVFAAVELRRFPDPAGKVMHAEVRIDDTVVMIADGAEGWPPVPTYVHVYVRDVDATYKRALEAGATSVQEPVKKQDADKRGGVRDAGGTTWWIATKVE